jgi:hypothetical protein
MAEEMAPGLKLLAETMIEDAAMGPFQTKLEELGKEAKSNGLTTAGFLTAIASFLGYTIGNGIRLHGGDDHLQPALDAAEMVMRDSAFDAAYTWKGGEK